MDPALTSLSATTLAGLIAGREVSAREVVEAHLRRIEAVNPRVNAVVQLDAERALAAADGAPPGPLHGVPFTVKDNLSAAGIEMAIGSPERVGVVPEEDATAVARVRAAGGILLGKTNCPEYGGGIETDNAVYGRTSNPFDLDRTPGGSSGGEAANIASGGAPWGLGTDSGASVRLPAHFCGLASLKPSAGRVPLTGVIDDEGQLGTLGDPRTQVGPLARSAEDVALLLRIVAGPDGRDGGTAPVPLGDASEVDLRGLRVAVQTANGFAAATPETVAAVEAAAGALRAAGAAVEEASHPEGGHELTIDVWSSYGEGVTATDLWGLLRRWDDVPLPHARLRRAPRPARVPGVPGARPRARDDERPRRGRPDELDHPAQPHRLAGGDGPRGDFPRGAADRRAARGRPVARRRRPRRRAARGARIGRVAVAAL